MSEKAPQVERLTESIKELHPVIKTAMKRDRQSILMKRSNVEREYGKYMGRVGSAPQQERVLTEIGRQREIKQGVYLVMLQKREETAMELANVADKGKLVDETMVNKNSRKPNKKLILIAALFAGILLPMTLLSLLEMFKSIIVYRKDLESITDLPILGEVLINDDLENFRKIRTNLLLNVQPDHRVIMFASENDGDGKTYLAHHMVEALSQIGKSVLYLDLDLRNSKPEGNILPSEYVNMNPADFFSHEEFGGLMAKYKSEYDYIVIDTPSIKEYTDAYQIANYVDATCFVVKSGKTPKQTIEKVTKSSILPNINFIINAIDMSKKRYKFYYKYFLSMLVFPLIISSCGSSEKIAYVQNPEQMSNVTNQKLFDARIMPKDILTVTVTTIDPEAAVPFNLSVPTTVSQASTKTLTSQPVLQDYLVANDGTIDFPIIGEIKVAGLTKKECEAMILEKISPYLADTEKPIVTVRMSSYSIAVLGEVKNPGSFPVSREKINVFEALAMAGDMTIYGVRDRVRLIREDAKGNKEIQILDLTDANIINSPYYYLQQNDIIYVEPSKVKKQDARVGSMTNLWFSATSILVSLASIIVTIAK
jgi:polysaccharide export outer membrane protein